MISDEAMKQPVILFLAGVGALAVGCGSGDETPNDNSTPDVVLTLDVGVQEEAPSTPPPPVEEDAGTQPVELDVPEALFDVEPIGARRRDTGVRDTGVIDTGPRDTGVIDTGPRDTGVIDTGPRDTGVTDTGPRDTGVVDAGAGAATACTAATGGGSTTVRAPTLLLSLQDRGEESWLGAPAVADLDRDGTNEIIVARETRVVAWRANGTVRFSVAPGTARVWAPPLVGDFTGDASLEVVAAAGARVVMYTAAGAVSTGFPATWRDEVRALAGGDLDADGRPEIVAATTDRLQSGSQRDLIKAFRGTGATMTGFPPNTSGAGRCDGACDVTGGFDQNLAVGFIDTDARADILAPMDNAYASWHRGTGEAFPAATGYFTGVTRVPGIRFFTSLADAMRGWAMNESTAEQAHFTNTAPAIADIDGDGTRELIMLGSIQNASQTDRRRGVGLFVVRADGTRPTAWAAPYQVRQYLAGLTDFGGNIVAATNQVSVANVDAASAGQEMVFAGFDGRIWCVGADKSTRWSYQYTTSSTQVTGGVVIADLSGDGRPEIIFNTYSTGSSGNALIILSSSGALLHRITLPGRGAMAVPAVADVNRDGTLEIVVNLKDASSTGAEVLVYTVPGSATNCTPWPMGRRNLLRNGSI